MAWWEGVDETRVLIAPDYATNGDGLGHFLALRHPKSGNTACYLYIDGGLLELHWFKQSYGSWFLGDYVCGDGRLYTATPVDPVFVLLPIFEEARMKKGDDPGKFRQLDEIIYIDGYPGYQRLASLAEKSLEVVCDIKVVDAVSIVGEYLKEEPWLKLLCDKLKLSPQDVVKAPDTNILSSSAESGLPSFNATRILSEQMGSHSSKPANLIPEKNGIDKKATRAGRIPKKAKVEIESQNIKDMFSRASRKRK